MDGLISNFFCGECIATEPLFKFLLWAGLLASLSAYALFKAYRCFTRARLIEDMPTSRVRSASQGFTELIGVARVLNDRLLSAPLSGTPCLWWRYSIEKYTSSGKSSHWVTVESGSSDEAFELDDGSGRCQVNPQGADLSARHRRRWHGRHRHPSKSHKPLTGAMTAGFLNTDLSLFGRRYRYTEQLIKAGDPLYVLGHFTSNSGERSLSAEKLAGNILRSWKQDFSQLLAQYDTNGDGELDLKEWAVVQQAAKREVRRQQRNEGASGLEHSISKPAAGGLPFLIGSQEQSALSKRYRWRALAYSIGFLLAGTGATWYISARIAG